MRHGIYRYHRAAGGSGSLYKKAIEEQEESSFPKELNGTGGRIVLHKNHNPGFSFGFLKRSRNT